MVTSFSNDLLAVKESDLFIKIFETNTSYLKDEELLFEYNRKIYTAKIDFTVDGDGFFMYEGKAIKIPKKDKKGLTLLYQTYAFNMRRELPYDTIAHPYQILRTPKFCLC